MKTIPEYSGTLRSHLLTVPKCISECSGIRIFGRRIKSLVFSTDVAIIKNVNADAIIAVYPFTPQPSITQAIISVSEVPVFVGVGGGMTNGDRSVRLAEYSEHQGASGVVVNAPITNETIAKMKQVVDIRSSPPLSRAIWILPAAWRQERISSTYPARPRHRRS